MENYPRGYAKIVDPNYTVEVDHPLQLVNALDNKVVIRYGEGNSLSLQGHHIDIFGKCRSAALLKMGEVSFPGSEEFPAGYLEGVFDRELVVRKGEYFSMPLRYTKTGLGLLMSFDQIEAITICPPEAYPELRDHEV